MREGWKCPVCNRGLSPNVQHCDHVGANPLRQTPAIDPLQPGWPGWPYPQGIGTATMGGVLSTPEHLRNRPVYFSRDLDVPPAGEAN